MQRATRALVRRFGPQWSSKSGPFSLSGCAR
ncbi:Protein of unknown function [Propionibacterium freudenreichii]|nr:Protein of unknown function [Propionibacterium freudenreichii]